jgi:defect-in-organelle-trafficking protein DotD
MFKKTLLLCGITLMLSACSSNQPQPLTQNEFGNDLLAAISSADKPTEKHTAEIKLAEAAVSVSKSLRQMAETERAVHPHKRLPAPKSAEELGMSQHASLDWSGPIEPLLKKIAKYTHYNIRILGKKPAIEVLVSVTATDTPLAEIVRDVGFQAEQKVNIAIYPHRRILELRYLRS